MSKHTPAPWTVREVTGLTIPGQRAFAIDFNEDQEQVVDWVYEEADAHLIAAAPDLLEALEGMVSMFPTGVEDEGSGIGFNENLKSKYRSAIKAIARARGES